MSRNLTLPIEELELPVRVYNCLKREGIDSVGDLVARTEHDLRDIRSLGARSVKEITQKLAERNLALREPPPETPSLREWSKVEHAATRKRLLAIQDPIERMVEAVKITNRADSAKFNERVKWLQAARWLHKFNSRRYSKHGMSVWLTPCDERMFSKGFKTLPASQTQYQGEEAAKAVAETHYQAFRRQNSIRFTANTIFQDIVRDLLDRKVITNKEISELTGYPTARISQIKHGTTNGPQDDEEDAA